MSCNCQTGIENTGFYSCIEEVMKDAVGVIIVPRTANDGTTNNITIASDTLNQTFFENKFNQEDASKRWFPVLGFKEVEETFEDSVTKDYSDGTSVFLRDGAHNWTSLLVKKAYTIIKAFKATRCVDHGVYIIDSDGKMSGLISDDGATLDPYPVQKDTVQANPNPAVAGSSPQEIMYSFQFGNLIKMENTGVVLADDIAGYSLLNAGGLLNVSADISSITTTGCTLTLTLTDYGNYKRGTTAGIAVEGWVDTDLQLNELSPTPGSISITSVTEGAAGVYAVVYPAQTSADQLAFSSAVSAEVFVKKGFQLKEADATFVIP